MKSLNPANWPAAERHPKAMSARGRMIVTGAVQGSDEHGSFPEYRLHDQFAQALRNTVAILAEDGARPQHIVRMTCYVTERVEYLNSCDEISALWPKIMGDHYPAISVVEVKSLIESAAKVAIETTAVVEE